MSAVNWILLVIMVVFLVIIGILISKLRDEQLYKEMKAEERTMVVEEEAIVMEGMMDKESFKPHDEVHEVAVEVTEEQVGGIPDAEVEVGEGELIDDTFKPPGDAQKTADEVIVDKDQKIADAEVGAEGRSVGDEQATMVGE